MKRLLPIACSLALCGCETPRKPVSAPFDEAAHQRQAVPGNCSIHGQAFMLTRGGEVRLGAGRTVNLYPATEYTLAVWSKSAAGEKVQADPRWKQYLRKTTVDGQGNFEFTGLSPGRWLLDCSITWEAPAGQFLAPTGGIVRGDVTLVDGQSAKVILR